MLAGNFNSLFAVIVLGTDGNCAFCLQSRCLLLCIGRDVVFLGMEQDRKGIRVVNFEQMWNTYKIIAR